MLDGHWHKVQPKLTSASIQSGLETSAMIEIQRNRQDYEIIAIACCHLQMDWILRKSSCQNIKRIRLADFLK